MVHSKTITMGKKPKKSADLSEAAIVERAKSMGVEWMWAVSLQYDRITRPRPQDKAFHQFGSDDFVEADVHFLVIALRRLRTVASTLEHAPKQWDAVRDAIQKFDARLPWLKRLRDVFEHLEDYAVDSDRRRTRSSRKELQVWVRGEKGLQWLGYDVNWHEAKLAAEDLYSAVINAYDSFASNRTKLDGQA